MSPGYDTPLYLLAFDHRHSYLSGLFHVSPPLSARQRDAVVDSKRVIYDGFRDALKQGVARRFSGVLVDEEFGAGILHDAKSRGFITALSTERSGLPEFEFEFGTDFARHIEAFQPTFAKALVRYNPEGDAALNLRQIERLKRLSDYCHDNGQRFMFELLVPPTDSQRSSMRDPDDYDLALRPSLVLETISTLQDASVEPDIWKIEGLDRAEDCEKVVEIARRAGRLHVACIVLGRAASEAKVTHWLEVAASVSGFIGFAVGRTTFWDALTAYVSGEATREETSSLIASRYGKWAATFERAKMAGVTALAR